MAISATAAAAISGAFSPMTFAPASAARAASGQDQAHQGIRDVLMLPESVPA